LDKVEAIIPIGHVSNLNKSWIFLRKDLAYSVQNQAEVKNDSFGGIMSPSFGFQFALIFTAVLSIVMSSPSVADDLKSKAKEVVSDMGRGTKKTGRAIKDKTCEMSNGKMECAAQKLKHSVQNAADQLEDAVD
jgi:uncharacterized protein YjbJ (UPF0337 family)